MMNHVRRKSLNGLTLVEALVAASLAGVTVAGLFQVTASYATVGARGMAVHDASVLAAQLIDQFNGRDQMGQFGDVRWRMSAEESAFATDRRRNGFRLVVVSVEIQHPRLRQPYRLTQERMIR